MIAIAEGKAMHGVTDTTTKVKWGGELTIKFLPLQPIFFLAGSGFQLRFQLPINLVSSLVEICPNRVAK